MATFTFRIEEQKKRQLAELAHRHGRKPATLLTALVDQLLKAPNGATAEMSPRETPTGGRADQKITARLTQTEDSEVRRLAHEQGLKPATWVAHLIRRKLRKGPQPLTRDEVAALRESTRQLQAIGRNLNQIARVTNIDWREAERLKREHIKQLAQDIAEHTRKVGALLNGAAAKWDD